MIDSRHHLGDPGGITPAGIHRWLSSMSTETTPTLSTRLIGDLSRLLNAALPAHARRRVAARRGPARQGPLVILA